MRPAEGNADDGDEAKDSDTEMGDRQPDARQQEPDDIADEAERAGADILLARQLVAVDRLIAEGQEGEMRDVEGGAAPGNADDGDEHDEGGQKPGEPHQQSAADQPEKIERERHRGSAASSGSAHSAAAFDPS